MTADQAANDSVAEPDPVSVAEPDLVTVAEPGPESEPVMEEPPKPSGTINLSEGSNRCQAVTAKGTQCKRDTGLTTLERTIEKQKYRFAVCNQHKNQSFKPFAELIN